MKRVSVQSSNICSIGYDENQSILQVEFNNGSIYNYYNVPRVIYSELINAESHGRYLDKHVKKAGFRYTDRKSVV